jgi:hypothetical protein
VQLGEIANTKTIKSEHSNSMYLALRYEMGCPPSSICARRALKFSRRADHCSRVPQGCLGMPRDADSLARRRNIFKPPPHYAW